MSYNKDLREKYLVRTKGIKGIIPFGTTDVISYKLMHDKWLSGVKVILENHATDDELNFSIVDKDFLFGSGENQLYPSTPTLAGIPGVEGLTWQQVTPNGVHLDNFGETYQIATDKQDQGKEEPNYWAKLLNGMYIEVKYTSTGTTDVTLKCNLYFHKEKS